jgi:hypothetical protein
MKKAGVRGELLVAEKLISKGWAVSIPIGDSDPFDIVANKDDKVRRIQVKTTLNQHSYSAGASPHYQFQLAKGKSSKTPYLSGQVDFFVCCALDSLRFWVIPFPEVRTITAKIYNGNKGRFYKFEGAWHLLDY